MGFSVLPLLPFVSNSVVDVAIPVVVISGFFGGGQSSIDLSIIRLSWASQLFELQTISDVQFKAERSNSFSENLLNSELLL